MKSKNEFYGGNNKAATKGRNTPKKAWQSTIKIDKDIFNYSYSVQGLSTNTRIKEEILSDNASPIRYMKFGSSAKKLVHDFLDRM